MVAMTLMVRWARIVLAPAWRLGLCAALCLSALACGGGGSVASLASGGSGSSGSSAPTGSNVVSVVVDAGPTTASPDVNTLFTTVTVCVPGTTNCQTIDHIQVDTGSFGLRILASVLTVALPVQTFTNGASLLECTAFVDGYSWGPVALADVQISGESAASVPVQVIGDPNFTSVPTDCSSIGPAEDTVATFGANGVLGVGVFAQDCGAGCVGTVDNGFYYACTPTALCNSGNSTTVALTGEVTDPVTLFAADNNGVIIQLPSVAAQGAATVTGSMIFGIDTQTNNKSGSQTVLTVDSTAGEFTTFFNGQPSNQSLNQSFLDTGSNGLYFTDSSIAPCMDTGLTEFYCPANTQSLTATLQGQNSVSASVSFSVGNAETLFNNASFAAFPTLGGTYTNSAATFDWGLPFYFGRTVYTAFENETTSVGTGPYVAF